MTSYKKTRARLMTLIATLDAANSPDRPNGTTLRINRDIAVLTDATYEKIKADAHRPRVPNGTTKKIIGIIGPQAERRAA